MKLLPFDYYRDYLLKGKPCLERTHIIAIIEWASLHPEILGSEIIVRDEKIIPVQSIAPKPTPAWEGNPECPACIDRRIHNKEEYHRYHPLAGSGINEIEKKRVRQ